MDQELTCQDCKNFFIFTEGEQAFYEGKGFTPPKRCADCRKVARNNFNARQVERGGDGNRRTGYDGA